MTTKAGLSNVDAAFAYACSADDASGKMKKSKRGYIQIQLESKKEKGVKLLKV